jgi:hypothetical protein
MCRGSSLMYVVKDFELMCCFFEKVTCFHRQCNFCCDDLKPLQLATIVPNRCTTVLNVSTLIKAHFLVKSQW